MTTVSFRDLTAILAGIGAFLTFFRYAEWFDTARALNHPIVFYYNIIDGLVLAIISLVLVLGFLWIVGYFVHKNNLDNKWFVIGTSLVYFITVILILYFGTVKRAPEVIFDAGLVMFLMINGFILCASNFLYKRVYDFESRKFFVESNNVKKYLDMEHKEISDLTRDMIYLIIFITVVLVYQFTNFWWNTLIEYIEEGTQNLLVWRTLLGTLLYYVWIEVFYIIGIIRPLFLQRNAIKDKFIEKME